MVFLVCIAFGFLIKTGAGSSSHGGSGSALFWNHSCHLGSVLIFLVGVTNPGSAHCKVIFADKALAHP